MEYLELYRQDEFPVFQNRMYDSVAEARGCPRGDIRIVQDAETGLVRNAAFDPSLMHYDSAYQNEQGLSAQFDAHLDRIADLVLALLGTEGLVEVGCGKALFLDKLRRRGADITGFDPAYEGDDPTILRRVFVEDLGIRSRGLILRHVLEHIDEPDLAVQQATKFVFVSIPIFADAGDIVRSHHFRKTEHIWYFTDDGIKRWFAGQGFECVEQNTLECHLGRKGVASYAFRRI